MKYTPLSNTEEGKVYFLAKPNGAHSWYFWSQMKSGKDQWTVKPGIAHHYKGGTKLNSAIASNARIHVVALEVPANHAKLWRAKK